MRRRLAWLVSVGFMSASATLIAAAHAQALQTAPASPARMIGAWPGIVLFCMPSREAWGATACGIASREAERQAAAASIKLIAVSAAEAGLSLGPNSAAPSFVWPQALRLFLQFHPVGDGSKRWRLSTKAYELTPPAPANAGQAPKWHYVYDHFSVLDEGKEISATQEAAPPLLERFFATMTKPRS
ncbi:hypothetical protein SAMN05216304_103780 [Bosea sp. OK403]|uniref:hypothetical protein n=1 Tax=Bosea sp. OK403 TaxID=1855286 RepID=UPI0008E2123F|nr:hypothetical protein [Bosea sp. OK403]SFI85755.1 hypothetical protein SAMN05216304_103780 [Bosea sp. OK403]